jgi:hypothetical protein
VTLNICLQKRRDRRPSFFVDVLFESLFIGVIPASETRRESFRKDSGQAGMTVI